MIKLAVVSDKKKRIEKLLRHLPGDYEIIARDDSDIDGLCRSVLELNDEVEDRIDQMFEFIESATGVNPIGCTSKDRRSMRAKMAASYVLRRYFCLSYLKIGRRLGCNHATVIFQVRKAGDININKNMTIESVVAKVLRRLSSSK